MRHDRTRFSTSASPASTVGRFAPRPRGTIWTPGSSVATLTLALLLSACSTVQVKVPVVRPAELDLQGKGELVVGPIAGNHGPEFESALKAAVADSGYFRLVDRTHLDSVLRELRLSVSDLAAPDARAKLGQLLTGSVLVAGSVDRHEYVENIEEKKDTCSRADNGKTVQYECRSFTRRGQVNVLASFDIVDVATGQNLRTKRLPCSFDRTTSAQESTPPPIDAAQLFELCSIGIVGAFMKAIVPWVDREDVTFSKDGDLPSLEAGVRFAEVGQWTDAIEAFQSAIALADTLPSLDAEDRAKAHRNLGLAYAYTGNFAGANEELKKAYAMSGEKDDLARLQHVRELEAERRALDAQLGKSAPR